MKTIRWTLLLAGCSLCFAPITVLADVFKEHISKTMTPQKPAAATVLAVHNISGGVRVESYPGSKVIIEIEKTITADDADDLARGKREFQFGFRQTSDSIIAYIAQPFDTRPDHRNNNNGNRHYEVTLQFTIKVPSAIQLHLSTVNGGALYVSNVNGKLNLHNVNGAITIVNARGLTEARTVNGSITANYLGVPPGECSFSTINGKLEATFPSSLSANLQFKSLNGEFYTDFPNTQVLPSKIVKSADRKNGSTVYKLDKNPLVQVGSGGQTFRFETLNGNIYVKKS